MTLLVVDPMSGSRSTASGSGSTARSTATNPSLPLSPRKQSNANASIRSYPESSKSAAEKDIIVLPTLPTLPPRKQYADENSHVPIQPTESRRDPQPIAAATFVPGSLEKLLMLDLQQDNGDQVAQAAEELESALNGEAWDRCESFHNLGGQSLLLLVMRKWQHNQDVQGSCCRCVSTLIRRYHPRDIKKRKALLASMIQFKVVELIFQSLANFPTDPLLHINGSAALAELLLTGLWRPLQIVHAQSCESMVVVTLRSMIRYRQYQSVQRYGCCVLACFLSLGITDASVLQTHGAQKVVLTAVKLYHNDVELKRDAFIVVKPLLGPKATSGLVTPKGEKVVLTL